MITKWVSFEEYSKWVEPIYLRKGLYNTRASESLLRQICRMEADVQSLWHASEQLRDSGYDGKTRKPKLGSSDADKHYAYVHGVCVHLGQLGESIFAANKSLAKSPQGMDFLELRDLQTDWDSYKTSGRIDQGINDLLGEAERLNAAYYDTVNDSDEFLIGQLSEDLPVFLRRDFETARDQFSVGLQEAGFLSAGRGLEGVLRAFAQKKGIWIDRKGSTTPAGEADFFDLIEVLAKVRWRSDKRPVLDTATKTLLHHLRTARNAAAHPNAHLTEENWRELAVVVAGHAGRLWKLAQRRYAGLVEKKISRA